MPDDEARCWPWLESRLAGAWRNLPEVKKEVAVSGRQRAGDALNRQALPAQPEHRGTDFPGAGASDEDDPLAPGRIELQGGESLPAQDGFDPILGTGRNACPVEITLR